jgi:hypothetical protein
MLADHVLAPGMLLFIFKVNKALCLNNAQTLQGALARDGHEGSLGFFCAMTPVRMALLKKAQCA